VSRLRNFTAIALFVGLAAFLVACGDDGDTGASAEDDPQTVLDRTFSDENSIDSGKMDMTVASQVDGPDGGSFSLEANGAVDGADQDLPNMDLEVSLTGDADGDEIDFDGGFVLTPDAGYITLNDETYEIDGSLLGQARQDAETAQGGTEGEDGEADGGTGNGLFGDLDVETFLTDLSNEGTTDVEGTETVHISGTVDTTTAIGELETALGGVSSLQGVGLGVPGLDELEDLENSFGDVTFDVYTGAEDNLLRKMDFEVPVQDGDSRGTATVSITLTEVNEEQTIEAPANAKSFSDLIAAIGSGALSDLGIEDFGDLSDLDSLGGFGGFGGGGGKGGGAGGDGAGGTAGASAGQSDAVQDATQAAQDIQQNLEGLSDEDRQAALECFSEARSLEDIQGCEGMVP